MFDETEIANLQFERSILSSLIFDPASFTDISKRLTNDHFFLAAHKNIFSTMKTLVSTDKPIDEEFIKQELSKAGHFDERVMIEILTVNPISNIDAYIDELAKFKDRRTLENLSIQFKKAAGSDDPISTAKALIANLENAMSVDKRLPTPTRHTEIEEKDAEFILKEWMPIPKNTVSLLTAPGGSGKTWLVLQMAARFCLEDTSKSAFLWLSEDPKSLSKARLNKILSEVIKTSSTPLKIDLADDPTPFILTEQNRRIGVNPIWNDLKRMFDPYDLIVLDPLIAFFGADENSNGHARYFMQLFTDYANKAGKTIIFIHHSTKGTTGARGAGAFVDAVRSVYEVDRIKDKDGKNIDESKSHLRTLKLTKDNYGASKLLKGIEVQRQIFPEENKLPTKFEIAFSGGSL